MYEMRFARASLSDYGGERMWPPFKKKVSEEL